jgi:hypothetical protein
MEGIAAMPPVESMYRPLRLRMQGWTKKRPAWQQAVQKALADTVAVGQEQPLDPFARLEQYKKVALDCARAELGTSGGKMRSLIPHHSREARRLLARLALLKVVRREIYARRDSGPQMPSRAMRTRGCILIQRTSALSQHSGLPLIGNGPKSGLDFCGNSLSKEKKSCMLCVGQSATKLRSKGDKPQ